jgi:hypothetical protein
MEKIFNIRETHSNLLKQIDKIFPISEWGKFFIPIIIFIIISLVLLINKDTKFNNEFYNLGLNYKVNNIERVKKGFIFQIDTNWYIIKHPIISHISEGDSIIKEPNSLLIKIKYNNIIKWEDEVPKDIIFRKINPLNMK